MKFETHAIAGFHRRPNSIASSFPLMSAINCGLKDLLISDDIEDQGGRRTLQPPITEDRRRPLFFFGNKYNTWNLLCGSNNEESFKSICCTRSIH